MSLQQRMTDREGVYRRDSILIYRAIVNKGDAATDDELVQLAAAVKFLGKTPQNVDDEVRACEEAKKLRRKILDLPKFTAMAEEAKAEFDKRNPELEKVIKDAHAERIRLANIAENLDKQRFKSTNAGSALSELIKAFPDAVEREGQASPEDAPINYCE